MDRARSRINDFSKIGMLLFFQRLILIGITLNLCSLVGRTGVSVTSGP